MLARLIVETVAFISNVLITVILVFIQQVQMRTEKTPPGTKSLWAALRFSFSGGVTHILKHDKHKDMRISSWPRPRQLWYRLRWVCLPNISSLPLFVWSSGIENKQTQRQTVQIHELIWVWKWLTQGIAQNISIQGSEAVQQYQYLKRGVTKRPVCRAKNTTIEV